MGCHVVIHVVYGLEDDDRIQLPVPGDLQYSTASLKGESWTVGPITF